MQNKELLKFNITIMTAAVHRETHIPYEGKTNPYATLLKSRFGNAWPNKSKALSLTPSALNLQEEVLGLRLSALGPNDEALSLAAFGLKSRRDAFMMTDYGVAQLLLKL